MKRGETERHRRREYSARATGENTTCSFRRRRRGRRGRRRQGGGPAPCALCEKTRDDGEGCVGGALGGAPDVDERRRRAVPEAVAQRERELFARAEAVRERGERERERAGTAFAAPQQHGQDRGRHRHARHPVRARALQQHVKVRQPQYRRHVQPITQTRLLSQRHANFEKGRSSSERL